MIGTFVLIFASISFIIVIGGAVYEHFAVVPVWTAAVPASLAMFQPPHGLAAANFWIPIHPVTLVLMAASLLINWRSDRRKFILVTLSGYALILFATFVFFVPELMSLTQSPFSQNVDPGLTARARTWEILSLVRLGFLLLLAMTLLWGLSLPGNKRSEPAN